MAEIRAFFALPITPQAEYFLTEAVQRLAVHWRPPATADIRWVAAENYHLTLAFLGNIHTARLPELERVAAAVAAEFPPQLLQLNSLDWFPSVLKPRLIVALPGPDAGLLALQKRLVTALRRSKIDCHGKGFRPHISLARIGGEFAPNDCLPMPVSIATDMDELVLYKSERDRRAVRYTPLLATAIGATL